MPQIKSKGSFYNLNNLNIYDYFSEKVILTQKKFIDYKNNKINTLQRELSLIKREINLYEKKNINDNNNSKKKSNGNNSKNNSMNKNMNKNQIVPKIIYVNKNSNKYYLINNNNSYISLNPFCNKDINNYEENADKKLENHLSNLLIENNSENNLKYKNNNKNKNINDNKKNLLNIMYQSKKGCYNHNNNNYDHNAKNIIKATNININKENSFKNNHLDKDIKHNLFFYTNKIKEKQIEIKDNKNIKRSDDVKKFNLENEYKTLEEKIDKLFNNFFQLYDKKSQK